MSEKIFCGGGNEFGQYGSVGLNVCLSSIPKEFITEYEGKKYIKLNVHTLRDPKKEVIDGVEKVVKSHYVEVNTFKPQKQAQQAPPQTPISTMLPAQEDDLPF